MGAADQPHCTAPFATGRLSLYYQLAAVSAKSALRLPVMRTCLPQCLQTVALANMGSAQNGQSISSRCDPLLTTMGFATAAGTKDAALHNGQTEGGPDLRQIE